MVALSSAPIRGAAVGGGIGAIKVARARHIKMAYPGLKVLVSAIVVVLLGSSIAQAEGPRDGHSSAAPLYGGPLIDNAATRAALSDMAREEDSYARSLAVTTHLVVTKVAADEEWRTFFGSTNWDDAARDRLEAADNQMYTNWGIDIVVTSYVPWDSNPDSGASCGVLLYDARADVGRGTSDVVAAFTLQDTGSGGCTDGSWAILIDYQSSSADWKVTQHELSHLYGASDVYGQENVHPNDVMENPYADPNKWCTYLQGSWNHFGTISLNSGKYD